MDSPGYPAPGRQVKRVPIGEGGLFMAINLHSQTAFDTLDGGAQLLGIDIALYAILTYLAAARTVDFIIEGIEEYIAVTIVSSHAEDIRMMIVQKLERGVTIYKGYRGHSVSREDYLPTEIILTVVTRLEVPRLRNEIQKIDPNAFVTMHSVKDTQGGIIKRRPMSEP